MSIEDKNSELIEKSLIELDKLRSETNKLLEIRKEIDKLINSNNELPKVFDERFSKIKTLVESFTLTLGKTTKAYVDGNNELFVKKLEELKTERENLQKQINELELQVKRIESIDLESGFNKLINKLTKILEVISSINMSLIEITDILTDVKRNLGNIHLKIDSNHLEIKDLISQIKYNIIDGFDSVDRHLTMQDNQTEINTQLFEGQIKSLSKQNDLIKKSIKANRIIQIIGIMLIIGILIYGLVK